MNHCFLKHPVCTCVPARKTGWLRNALSPLRLLLPILLLALSPALSAQDDDLVFTDHTYVDYIKAVRFHVDGVLQSYPLITLGGNARLRISFDDLNDDVRRYSYRFIHCNQDWQPSSLSPLEYNGRNTVGYIEDYDFSIRTLRNYVHYELAFPNRDMQIIASGNYLLVISDEEDETFPAITRRFMVQENLAGVSGRVMRPALVDQIHTHQEVDLTVNTKQLDVRNPMRELRATVIQNNRWDNAVYNIVPNLLQKESVRFDYQGRVSFRGGNEFRNLDIRSVRAPRNMVSVTNEEENYSMMMEADRLRDNGTYIEYNDFNGNFINDRFERLNLSLSLNGIETELGNRFDYNYSGDYVEMTFVLNTGRELNRDVYIFGGFTEFQLRPEFRMVWNPNINAYVGRALLKQGFYNYLYVQDQKPPENDNPRPSDRISYDVIEGSFDETENDYLALIYWRPIGGRYDRLVGSSQLNSSQN